MKGEFYEIGTYSKCGHCEQCINEKCNNWVIRNYYEEKMHNRKCFITLTYEKNPFIIVRKDLQDFMKRLRIELDRTSGEKIRMYGCMEYGELNNRPHGHVIIYGWEDGKAKYLDINKRKNIVYQSNLIQKVWGLGRTSYQPFYENEIPYLTLYDTPAEKFSKAYKLTREKCKKLRELSRSATMPENQRKNLLAELAFQEKKFEEEKNQYRLVKEFNTWSIALGWESFYDYYAKQNKYTFKEYIQDKEFVTPSPWVKKLANMGDMPAILEMQKRQEEIEQSANENEEYMKNYLKIIDRRKKEILDWSDKKDKITLL